jgi:hypothetical protein
VVSPHRVLLEVTYGRLTPWQVIQTASMNSHSPIRGIPLLELFIAEPSTSPEMATSTLRRLAVALDEDVDHVSDQNVGSLVHANSGGRRMTTLRAVMPDSDTGTLRPTAIQT